MSHLLISAAHKSSGKTTLSIGLCAALKQQGLTVQPFKKGPDYIDPMWLSRAAGRACYNLDFHISSRAAIKETFAQRMQGADIGLIEGNKGLYDGLDLNGSNSNAALATLLNAPVVLVIDARGMTRGIAPLILGYQAFEPDIHIAAVILNQVGGYRHEEKLRRVIEHYTDVPVLGAVHHAPEIEIIERHLGLMPSSETAERDEIIQRIADAVADQVDLGRVIELAAAAPTIVPVAPTVVTASSGRTVRIGIAQDAAFGFYYAGDLERFEQAGAELVPFNTLTDNSLPEIDGLFIGGGFPERQMAALTDNKSLRQAIRDFIEAGGVAYVECGGLMYLTRSLSWRGEKHEMVGAIPADCLMCERPQGRGYVRLRQTADALWDLPSIVQKEIAAHEFHYSRLENLGEEIKFAYEMLRGTGIDGHHDGIIYKNLLASYTHLQDTDRYHWVAHFVTFIRRAG
ncbi:MAG: hydrogenobyrinic acid a,c-diamide synthase (glutamine-hydrolyzing) [Candidatus Polarisedimenticolaceae bacterium]|nr:hydrogenobyrinic acid a,c-diamide synthase (glutamine-hydrolyzing) [Candidatus Polarisedimenticolaceae bacterium]